MFTIILLCKPNQDLVQKDIVETLRSAWGGRDLKWLSVLNAAEFEVAFEPGNFWDVWADFQSLNIDLIKVPTDNRKKKLLIADMDSTMIQQECIDELAAEAGVGDRVADITARAMNGELDFEAALDERVGLLTGLPASVIQNVLDTRIDLMPGGRALVQTMNANGGAAALVSGGFTNFADVIAAELGFHSARANTLLIEADHLTGKVARPILGKQAKVERLNELLSEHALDQSDVIAVGDGANDLGMLGMAGMGVALHAKPAVQKECDIRINHGDLTALLYLQGYAEDAFTTG